MVSTMTSLVMNYMFCLYNPPFNLYHKLYHGFTFFFCVSLWSVRPFVCCSFIPVCPFECVCCLSVCLSLNHLSVCLIFACLLQLSVFLSAVSYINCTPVCLTSTITTITKVTIWRGHKLVDVETAAVTNTDVGRPQATIRTPMETHFSTDNSISCSRVRAIQPTRCMGATSILSYTGRRHLCSCCTTKSIPSKR